MYSQKHQWQLLEMWYDDPNPKKDFNTFLQHNKFPSSNFEDGGLYYMQICKKFWYANRSPNQKAWVKQKLLENESYDTDDAVPTRFIHEGSHNRALNHKNMIIASLISLSLGFTLISMRRT